jgi:hypothetical protein
VYREIKRVYNSIMSLSYEEQDPMRRTVIGTLIFMEIHRRILFGQFGKIPKYISDWAFAEGGYCLDAPDHLPAGYCEYYELGPETDPELVDEFGNFGASAHVFVPRTPDE